MATNANPVTIYFDSLDKATDWADAHPEFILTIWGVTRSGNRYRCSFIRREKAEAEGDVPTV